MSIINQKFIFERTGHIVRNRAVLAAMTNKQSYENGILSNNEIKWLTRRAKGGFGIITTAATHVSRDGQGWEGEFGTFDDFHIPGLSELANNLKQNGAISIAQIFHAGMRSPQKLTNLQPISASKNSCEESYSKYSREATEDDIYRLINDFRDAALRCYKAGFDGIELHGAHGYLISQFLGSKTNRRSDQWGGSIKNRSKFLIEIIRAIKSKTSKDFLIGVRISPEINKIGIELHDSISLAKILRDECIDFLHLSCWDSFSPSKCEPDDPRLLTEWFTSTISDLPPIICTGGVWDNADVQSVFSQGADFVGVARAGIAHPDWAIEISNQDYKPQKPPFSSLHLEEADLSGKFIDYMRAWDGFVED